MAKLVDPAVEFRRHVPEEFLKLWVHDLEDCYRRSRIVGDTIGLRKAQADWNEPLVRRAMIESRVQDVAREFPQIEVVQAWAGKRSSPYIVLKVGPIVLTESMVENRCQLPREAGHRRANAQGNRHLFNAYEDDLSDDTPIYAILAHVPHSRDAYPQFIDVLFPNSSYDGILGHPIDLVETCSAREFAAPVVEEKIEEPTPELKKDQQKRKAD